ncbi:MAG TPA: hypothetical protein VFE41_25300 [Acetobacteraceae bacterium]|nr:hypothetical protein [Acetobacteraceae bacterium]
MPGACVDGSCGMAGAGGVPGLVLVRRAWEGEDGRPREVGWGAAGADP